MSVNLDAMLPRSEFDLEAAHPSSEEIGKELYLTSLTPRAMLALFRKPYFQRETSSWTPQIIADFIASVADGDVIPAIIIWRSPKTGELFVIDGAHRISALIAWILDDYGDRTKSLDFYGHSISRGQKLAAEETRALVDHRVGKYERLNAYRDSPTAISGSVEYLRSGRIKSKPLVIQQIQGDALAAEQSFIRINSTAMAISKTERELIDLRRLPVGLATRAILRAGGGHEFWKDFAAADEIKTIANDIYEELVRPIAEFPLVSMALPRPGRGYTADNVKTILDLVKFLNPQPKPKARHPSIVEPDDGTGTLAYLQAIRAATARTFGHAHKGSLALHPGVYCYNTSGRFVQKSFFGAIGLAQDLIARDQLRRFTKHRARFEDFLLSHPEFITQLGKTQGSGGERGVSQLIRFYNFVLGKLSDGEDDDGIVKAVLSNPELKGLRIELPEESELEQDAGESFSPEQKASVKLDAILASSPRCGICQARLYLPDASNDHARRKADGGKSVKANHRLSHPYCNSGFAEWMASEARKGKS